MASDKKRVGRPLKFESPEVLQKAIDAYFADCEPHLETRTEWVEARDKEGKLKLDEHGLHYLVEVTHKVMTEEKHMTITGLAVWLNTSRETLLNYSERPEFFDSINGALERCQRYTESHLYTNGQPTGAIFSLKNNYGWQDQTQLEHSGRIDRNVSEAELDAVLSRRQLDTQAS